VGILQSIFGNDAKIGGYPAKLVKNAIERAVDGTDPWIRGLLGYQRMLQPAVIRAIDHVVALAESLAPAIVLSPGCYGREPRLRSFFITPADLQKFLDNDRTLAEFRRGRKGGAGPIHALLAMEKQEKAGLGATLSGDIILRDVRQTTVSFEEHRLLALTEKPEETLKLLKRRAYDHLLSLALSRISIVKTERNHLERHRTLLHSRLNLLQRGGMTFDQTSADQSMNVADLKKQLAEIEQQFKKIGKDEQMLEAYLDILIDILGRPEKHLWLGKETLIVDRMGIKRSEVTNDAPGLPLDVLHNTEGKSLVVALVELAE